MQMSESIEQKIGSPISASGPTKSWQSACKDKESVDMKERENI
jgi:hypothetical protein